MAFFPVRFLCPPHRFVYEENALRDAAPYAGTAEAKGESTYLHWKGDAR